VVVGTFVESTVHLLLRQSANRIWLNIPTSYAAQKHQGIYQECRTEPMALIDQIINEEVRIK
jgi:hypothetical protein